MKSENEVQEVILPMMKQNQELSGVRIVNTVFIKN